MVVACDSVGVLEEGFTVEPWPTMRRALDEAEGTKKTSNAQPSFASYGGQATQRPIEFLRHSSFLIAQPALDVFFLLR